MSDEIYYKNKLEELIGRYRTPVSISTITYNQRPAKEQYEIYKNTIFKQKAKELKSLYNELSEQIRVEYEQLYITRLEQINLDPTIITEEDIEDIHNLISIFKDMKEEQLRHEQQEKKKKEQEEKTIAEKQKLENEKKVKANPLILTTEEQELKNKITGLYKNHVELFKKSPTFTDNYDYKKMYDMTIAQIERYKNSVKELEDIYNSCPEAFNNVEPLLTTGYVPFAKQINKAKNTVENYQKNLNNITPQGAFEEEGKRDRKVERAGEPEVARTIGEERKVAVESHLSDKPQDLHEIETGNTKSLKAQMTFNFLNQQQKDSKLQYIAKETESPEVKKEHNNNKPN